MKATHVLAVCASAFSLVVLSAQTSEAGPCAGGCKGEIKACVTSVHSLDALCRLDCRDAGGDIGSCLRSCRAMRRDQRQSCRAGGSSCRQDCRTTARESTSGDRACRGECGIEFGQCARDAVSGVRDCRAGCQGPERRECVEACKAEPADDLSDCKQAFDACVAACDGAGTTSTTSPTTTSSVTSTTSLPGGTSTTTTVSSTTSSSIVSTSTTTTTLPPCECAEAPTCAGTCPGGLVCIDMGAAGCGCFGGSPSPAFLR